LLSPNLTGISILAFGSRLLYISRHPFISEGQFFSESVVGQIHPM
jgi:hypothetical protein